MSDAKHPVIPKAKEVPKTALPKIRGSAEPITEVKIVSPDKVKTRRQSAAGDNQTQSQPQPTPPPAG